MIQGPEGTIPTRNGWVNPNTNRIEKLEKHSDPEIILWKRANAEFVNKIEEEKRQKLEQEKVTLVQDMVEVNEIEPEPAPPKKRRGRPKKKAEPEA